MIITSSRESSGKTKRCILKEQTTGKQIIVQREKGTACCLTPVGEDDLYLGAEMAKRIKESMGQVEEGKTKKMTTSAESNELLH